MYIYFIVTYCVIIKNVILKKKEYLTIKCLLLYNNRKLSYSNISYQKNINKFSIGFIFSCQLVLIMTPLNRSIDDAKRIIERCTHHQPVLVQCQVAKLVRLFWKASLSLSAHACMCESVLQRLEPPSTIQGIQWGRQWSVQRRSQEKEPGKGQFLQRKRCCNILLYSWGVLILPPNTSTIKCPLSMNFRGNVYMFG